MENPPVNADGHLGKPELARSIPIDLHIALAVAAVLVSVAAEQVIVNLHLDQVQHIVMVNIFIVTACGCLFTVIWRGIVARHPAVTAYSIALSLAVGSFLFGLITTILATAHAMSFSLGMIGAVIGVAAFALVIFMYSRAPTFLKDEATEDRGEGEALSIPLPIQSSQSVQPLVLPPRQPLPPSLPQRSQSEGRLTNQRLPAFGNGPPQLDIPQSINAEDLPPLFEQDPLFTFPQPKKVRLFIQAKSNDLLVNCEDACAFDPDETRFALCDGVGSSSLPRPWATLLAQQWVNEPFSEYTAAMLNVWLDQPRKRWQEWVYTVWLPTLSQRNRSIGWKDVTKRDADAHLEQGAAATFLGVTLDKEAKKWSAIAVGDTCLLLCRPSSDPNLSGIVPFPLTASNQFTDMPPSITSRLSDISPLLPYFKKQSAKYKQGDVLLMATDALAAWIFKQIEQRSSDWLELLSLTHQEDFNRLVDRERSRKRLNDDDTVLIVIPL